MQFSCDLGGLVSYNHSFGARIGCIVVRKLMLRGYNIKSADDCKGHAMVVMVLTRDALEVDPMAVLVEFYLKLVEDMLHAEPSSPKDQS